MKLKALASALWMGAKRHSPEILVGLGIAGAASSVIFAIKATPQGHDPAGREAAGTGR